MYIHDITLIAQADILITIKTILNRDLNNLHNYLKRWYLTLDLNKTVTQPHSGPPQGGGGVSEYCGLWARAIWRPGKKI